MSEALLGWRKDPEIKAVIIDHAQGRGFCAGGDVVMLARSGAGDGATARAFFHSEYRLNHLLFTYPKPTMALMDGITMGGGVGISLPCTYRVATENTRLAMPETGIGLFPDVGGGWYLSRLPGRVGQFMVADRRPARRRRMPLSRPRHPLCSAVLARGAGRADHRPCPSASTASSARPPHRRRRRKIAGNLAQITRAFAPTSSRTSRRRSRPTTAIGRAAELATIRTKSPLSCKVSLRLLAEGADAAQFRRRDGGWNMRSPAASSAPTTSSKACGRC